MGRRASLLFCTVLVGFSFTAAVLHSDLTQASSLSKATTDNSVFNSDDKRIIEDFFETLRKSTQSNEKKSKHKGKKGKGQKSKDLPPGLAKKETLPPGLAMQLKKNGTLPPGLQKRAIPNDLSVKLTRLPRDLERIIVGDDVLLVQKGLNIILDILKGAASK
jgi:hypothetical protein